MAYQPIPSSLVTRIYDPNSSVFATIRDYANSDAQAVAITNTSGNTMIGQSNMAGSLPVVLPSDQSAIPAQQSGNWTFGITGGSVTGTYADDATHTNGDKGLFILAVRNDTLASITSATGDYSQITVGPSGELINSIAPLTKFIQGTGDLRVTQGASVTVITSQGASVFTYIRSAQLANMGSASVLVTFGGGLGSILGYTIAPAGGGSNINFDPALKTGENSAFTASISGTASVLVSAQGFTAKI